MSNRILFLRPFRDPTTNTRQIKQLCRVTRTFAPTIILDDAEVSPGLRDIRGLEVHKTTDANWEREVLSLLSPSAAIIYHLAPKDRVLEGRLLDAIVSGTYLAEGRTELRHLGGGGGTLHELLMCREHGVLEKVIVLSPDAYLLRIRRILTHRPSFLGETDAAIKELGWVHTVIPYRMFGDYLFRQRLRRALLRVLSGEARPVASDTPFTPFGKLLNFLGIFPEP